MQKNVEEFKKYLGSSPVLKEYTNEMLEVILEEVLNGIDHIENKVLERFEESNFFFEKSNIGYLYLGMAIGGAIAYALM